MLFAISPWKLAPADEDINRNWENWTALYFAAVDECVPKYRQKSKSNAPWITKELIKLSRKRETCIKRLKDQTVKSTGLLTEA